MARQNATSSKKALVQRVWNKAATIRGKDPKKYRKDPYGNTIYRASYGKTSKMGWQMDHIKPKAKGGTNVIRNLQALQSGVNNRKKCDMRKKNRHVQKRQMCK